MRWTLGVLAAALVLCACSDSGAARKGPDLGVILAGAPAAKLSDYGLFADMASATPAPGVLSYDLINPLFTDHAEKHRLVFVPAGQSATYDPHDVFGFPAGSVLVKTFTFAPDMRAPQEGAYRVETRLLIRMAEGWAAYPYIWNEEQTEAVYAPTGGRQVIETIAPSGEALSIRYAVPNQNQCKTCHQAGKDIEPIGPKARHLAFQKPGNGGDQLARWVQAGILEGAPAEVLGEAYAFDPWQPLDARARAWLEINCAHCHKPDGSASNSGLWLTQDVQNLTQIGVFKHPVAAGRGSGGLRQVIVPGDPGASILLYRMESSEPGIAMPELGRSVADPEGTELIRAWIAAMETP